MWIPMEPYGSLFMTWEPYGELLEGPMEAIWQRGYTFAASQHGSGPFAAKEAATSAAHAER